MARSSRKPWSRQLHRQRVHAAGAVCRTGTDNHQLPVPAERQIQDDWAMPTLQTHLLDYVLVRQRDLRDVLATHQSHKDCNTDHRLIQTKVRLSIKRAVRKKEGHR